LDMNYEQSTMKIEDGKILHRVIVDSVASRNDSSSYRSVKE